ncbi:MAG TPA: PrsW family glutamic-type intramembrane protease [Ramlibacter sp.]|jgi:RsiW-degrading membrane proteinase PrsW (M82 family)
MSSNIVAGIVVGLLPVVAFLAALVSMDSYKLVPLKAVVATVGAGAVAAVASYFANGALLEHFPMALPAFSRYVAPLVEESFKAAIVLVLIRSGRIAFLVDAAIFGFAAGTGFSILENAYYVLSGIVQVSVIATWIVRGFGTAIMHGGATAIFAVTCLDFLDRPGLRGALALVPGIVLAYGVHSAYNHALLPPLYETCVVVFVVPALLALVFWRSEKLLGEWLGTGFDNDAQLLQLINSGRFTESPMGHYLSALRDKFEGAVLADILCYVRLHTELALRAKGLLMMRETGFDAPADESVHEKFAELRYLESSIGPTGRMAIRPMLHLSRKDLRQLYLL